MSNQPGPHFVDAHDKESDGVDYLGLRATNLSLMNMLLPGINNVVNLVRLFSVMCWICWRYERVVVESKRPARPDEFNRFREKIETLFVWSHVQLRDAAGLPGNQQKDDAAEQMAFSFEKFKRKASLMDAALYGPAMKTQNGLKFLYPLDGFFKVTDAGAALAKGLDESLQATIASEQYEFVASISSIEAPRDALNGLAQGWHVDTPSEPEMTAFRQQFYQPTRISADHRSREGNRSTMLHFVLAVVRRQPGLTVAKTRWEMACRQLPDELREHNEDEQFKLAQRAWRELQTRQAQRLGLEGLFGWLERCLVHSTAHSVEQLVYLTSKAFKDRLADKYTEDLHSSRYAFYRNGAASVDELFERMSPQSPVDIFSVMERIEADAAGRSLSPELAINSIELLLNCGALVDAFFSEPSAASNLDYGPHARVPLSRWRTVILSHLALPFDSLLAKIFETFLISQHLGVAAARSGDERSRMRISIEDGGLVSLLSGGSKVLAPVRTQDRLATAMSLMASCGLLASEGRYRYEGERVAYSSQG